MSAAALIALFKARGLRLATAESCTGGLVAGAVTAISGSSAIFTHGFVTYANEAKTQMLGVPAAMLEAHGAVSPQVAGAMAEGARARAGADYAVSTTGVAGPDGGSVEKPVGTVWFGLAGPGGTRTYHKLFQGNRDEIRAQAVDFAIALAEHAAGESMSRTLGAWDKAKREGRKMTMVTAYDYTAARMAEAAGLDAVLIGDSLGMMVAGEADTLPVSLEQMEYHTRIVARAVSKTLVMADLPFGSFEESPAQAFAAAARLLKAGAQIVKLEGAAPMVETVAFLSRRAIPVCAHIGLTPQHVRQIGGFRRQGKTPEAAAQLLEDAIALQDAGARMLLMEAIPAALAAEVTARLVIPTIGIGAGPGTDAQVLVFHDVLGLNPDRAPPFAKKYMDGAAQMTAALAAYVREVREGAFPA